MDTNDLNTIGEVERVGQIEYFTMYRTSCVCNDESHDATFSIDYDESNDEISLDFYVNAELYVSAYDGILKSIWKRIKTAILILFYGYCENHVYFTFRSAKHVQGVIDALKEGIDIVEKKKPCRLICEETT